MYNVPSIHLFSTTKILDPSLKLERGYIRELDHKIEVVDTELGILL